MKTVAYTFEFSQFFIIVPKEDFEIYVYSYKMLFVNILLWASAILVGLLTKQLLGMLIFMAFFVPLRQYAGGIHVKSQVLCYAITVGIFLLVCAAPYLRLYDLIQQSALYFYPISAITLLVFAPQADPNKPASTNEHRHFRKMARLILAVECITVIAMLILRCTLLSFFALSGINICSIFVLVSVLVKRTRINKKAADSK